MNDGCISAQFYLSIRHIVIRRVFSRNQFHWNRFMPQIFSMKAEYLVFLSFLLTFAVVTNAFYTKKQFYPSVVYLTKSSTSLAVLYAQAFVFVILFGKLIQRIFLGQLRAIETEHLYDRTWFSVTETCLAFTVFRDDFSPRFVALFAILLFLKCFHWLLEDRVDYVCWKFSKEKTMMMRFFYY